MKNKRGGVIGGFITTFLAIIAIMILLGALFIIKAPYKKYVDSSSEVAFFGEEEGEESLVKYMDEDYKYFLDMKFTVAKGGSLEDAIIKTYEEGDL